MYLETFWLPTIMSKTICSNQCSTYIAAYIPVIDISFKRFSCVEVRLDVRYYFLLITLNFTQITPRDASF